MSNTTGAGSSQQGTTNGGKEKDKDGMWYFSSEQLASSPSRRQGIDSDQELSYRQLTAYLIQEMGQRLQVSQLCINTAIVYMHRFYAFHSFTHFYRNGIAAASLFLAAKVEEQPRKLEHVIKAANKCLNQPTSSTTDASYIEQAQDLVFNENVLLQTLGFDVAIDHPHTHVVKTCHLVKACKDLAQTSYFLASNSLHLTSMCLQYKPTVVACFCIYLACKWSRWEIPQSTEGKHWFHYVDKSVTMDLLKQLTDEFIGIYEKSPARLKSKLNSIKALAQGASTRVISKDKKAPAEEWKMVDMMKMYHSSINTNDSNSSSGQSSMYSTPPEQQVALLPPPTSQQQTRKSDTHSSQNRAFHNSSGHHHSKMVFPSGDVSDHKTSHRLASFSGGPVNRPREQGLQSIAASSNNSSRSTPLPGRPATNTSLVGQSSQRQPTQSHQFDVNFHKSRDRGNNQGLSSQTSAGYSGHKLSQKQEGLRNLSKDTSVKMLDQTKASTSKIFSSSIVGQQFGNHPHLGSSLSTSKVDGTHDIARNISNNPRGSFSNSSTTTGTTLAYNQTQLPSRQASSTIKHDHSKPSVHIQQQLPKQSAPSEALHITGVPEQLPHHSLSSASYTGLRNTEVLHNEENPHQHYNPAQSLMPPTQAQIPSRSSFSMFSPDWSDKLQNPFGGSNFNGSLHNAGNESLGFKGATATSPKKAERERMTDTMLKKRHLHSGNDSNAAIAVRSTTQQQFKTSVQKKLDAGPINEISGTSAAIKRSNESTSFKQDDEILRDNKLRKLDNCYPESKFSTDLTKLQVVNGIETNPDLVRSLLKESLCTTNALLKTEPLVEPCLFPPADLLATSAVPPLNRSQTDFISQLMPDNPKIEKKKKKEKHKHKEKDKSKDREERKKHKKEKDKHKDRDRQYDNSEPVKIKICKEKLESVTGSMEPVGFKIKIPKDRITSELNSNVKGLSESDVTSLSQAPALKIKISKDKLENYSSGSTDTIAQLPMTSQCAADSLFSSHNTALGAVHSKKKDRDRKRNINDFTKSNGSSGLAALPLTSSKNQANSKLKEF